MSGKNTKVTNPVTGALEFGFLHQIIKINIKLHLEPGFIYLKYGEHTGKNRGFGLVHIWEEHSAALINMGYRNPENVANYILDIIVPGASIHVEDYRRPTIIKSPKGVVVLEGRNEKGSQQYSVITAYPRPTARGSLVGAIMEMEKHK